MDFVWRDYQPDAMAYVEQWLDASAVGAPGLDEGFRNFYEYWKGEEGFSLGENFWCKVVSEGNQPFAVVALCQHEGKTLIMELVVAPEKRGQGKGTKLLKALLDGEEIIGATIQKCEAVIFPGNKASQRAFEKAGFQHHHSHEDGTALYYVWDATGKGRR